MFRYKFVASSVVKIKFTLTCY